MREVLASLNHLACSRPDDLALADDQCSLRYSVLAGRVAFLASKLEQAPSTVAIYAPNSVHWVITDLALALAGKTMVPLPTFFSPEQLTHIVDDAGVDLILTTQDLMPMAQGLNRPCQILSDNAAHLKFPQDLSLADHSRRIIYTSGTTGSPKGVRIGARQISASAQGLVLASEARDTDRYLSVLPFSLLLEQISAICVPLLVGAPIFIDPNAAGGVAQGNLAPFIQAFANHQPTVSVLVPQLLKAWVQGLITQKIKAPVCLRFIAVGGAPVSPSLSDAAWQLGIPVHEGYGLSECCSVVSVNRPTSRCPTTVGKPIEGTEITIIDGEIVVTGPTVMDGYLGRDDLINQTWHTGDLGCFNPQGDLCISGRKDNLIVTPNGRNISPEWIETLALDTPGIMAAKLRLNSEQQLELHVTSSRGFKMKSLKQNVREHLKNAPKYAQPDLITITNSDELRT